jgi:hypothetical protein
LEVRRKLEQLERERLKSNTDLLGRRQNRPREAEIAQQAEAQPRDNGELEEIYDMENITEFNTSDTYGIEQLPNAPGSSILSQTEENTAWTEPETAGLSRQQRNQGETVDMDNRDFSYQEIGKDVAVLEDSGFEGQPFLSKLPSSQRQGREPRSQLTRKQKQKQPTTSTIQGPKSRKKDYSSTLTSQKSKEHDPNAQMIEEIPADPSSSSARPSYSQGHESSKKDRKDKDSIEQQSKQHWKPETRSGTGVAPDISQNISVLPKTRRKDGTARTNIRENTADEVTRPQQDEVMDQYKSHQLPVGIVQGESSDPIPLSVPNQTKTKLGGNEIATPDISGYRSKRNERSASYSTTRSGSAKTRGMDHPPLKSNSYNANESHSKQQYLSSEADAPPDTAVDIPTSWPEGDGNNTREYKNKVKHPDKKVKDSSKGKRKYGGSTKGYSMTAQDTDTTEVALAPNPTTYDDNPGDYESYSGYPESNPYGEEQHPDTAAQIPASVGGQQYDYDEDYISYPRSNPHYEEQHPDTATQIPASVRGQQYDYDESYIGYSQSNPYDEEQHPDTATQIPTSRGGGQHGYDEDYIGPGHSEYSDYGDQHPYITVDGLSSKSREDSSNTRGKNNKAQDLDAKERAQSSRSKRRGNTTRGSKNGEGIPNTSNQMPLSEPREYNGSTGGSREHDESQGVNNSDPFYPNFGYDGENQHHPGAAADVPLSGRGQAGYSRGYSSYQSNTRHDYASGGPRAQENRSKNLPSTSRQPPSTETRWATSPIVEDFEMNRPANQIAQPSTSKNPVVKRTQPTKWQTQRGRSRKKDSQPLGSVNKPPPLSDPCSCCCVIM